MNLESIPPSPGSALQGGNKIGRIIKQRREHHFQGAVEQLLIMRFAETVASMASEPWMVRMRLMRRSVLAWSASMVNRPMASLIAATRFKISGVMV